jgi:hypothetical protein
MLGGAETFGSIGLGFLAAHFALYVGLRRQRSTFQTERGIFLYHFISAALFGGGCAAVVLLSYGDVFGSVALALIAAHGIYSISFLELWSLSQGSYSLSILNGVQSGRIHTRQQLIESFTHIGSTKKLDRLTALASSQLIRRDGAYWRLNRSGVLVATILRGLLWLANIKERG